MATRYRKKTKAIQEQDNIYLTEIELRRAIEKAVRVAKEYVKNVAPVDTGWLQSKIRYMRTGKNNYKIFISSREVPYASDTNKGYATWRNPNAHWWDEAAKEVRNIIEAELNSALKK